MLLCQWVAPPPRVFLESNSYCTTFLLLVISLFIYLYCRHGFHPSFSPFTYKTFIRQNMEVIQHHMTQREGELELIQRVGTSNFSFVFSVHLCSFRVWHVVQLCSDDKVSKFMPIFANNIIFSQIVRLRWFGLIRMVSFLLDHNRKQSMKSMYMKLNLLYNL